MRIEDYPEQEPLTEAGLAYQRECLRLSGKIRGEEIAYGTDDPTQGLLIFPAAKPNGTVLGWMHGGGWTNGYKEMMTFMAPPLNAGGVTFASFSYRMAPRHSFPTGWHDAAAAVAWLCKNVARYGGDPRRLFIGGHSAGAHYAALLAVRRNWQDRFGVPKDVLRGCLPISGIYDFTPGSGLSVRPRFLGPADGLNEVHASPIFNLEARPPMLLAHGSDDFPHLGVQARKMEVVLRAGGVDVERIELPGKTHFTACYAAGEENGLWHSRAMAWLAAH